MADLRIAVEIAGKDSASGPIGAVGAALKSLGTAAEGPAAALVSFGKAALTVGAVAGAGLATGIGAAVAAAAGFEKTMSGVGAVSGATGAQMQQLSGLALQLGKDTSFSASEAASGIEELVKGGLTIPDIMNGAAKSMLDLAAAGGVSLPEAATIAANALAEFGLKGQDMAHVADLIAGAANASALDVGQFALSLQASGAVAATVGFSFDDLAQAIAVMGKAGITGSDAGTSLKTMMLNLTPATDKARGLMQELGIITKEGANRFFDATGKVKSFADVSQILQDATSKLTQEQKLSTLQMLFGTDAVRAAAVMAKEGAAGVNEMAAAMGKVTAADVAAKRLDNLKGSFEQLKGSVETAAITLGLALLPALRGAVDGATGFVNSLIPFISGVGPQIAATLISIGERLQTFVRGLLEGASLATVVNRAFGDLIPAGLNPILDAAGAAFGALRGAAAGLLGTLQSGGLAAIWQQVTAAMTEFAPTGERIQGAIAAIGQAIALLVPQPITDFVTGLTDSATQATAGQTPLQLLAAAINAVSGVVAGATQFVRDHVAVQALLVAALTGAATVWTISTVATIAHTVATTAAAVQLGVATAAQWLLNAALTANPIGIVVVAIAALAAGLIYAYQNSETFRDAVDGAFAVVKAAVQTTMTVVVPLIAGFAATAVAAAPAVGRFVTDVVGFFATLQTAVTARMNALLASVPSAWASIRSSVAEAVAGILSSVSTAFASMQTAITGVQDAVTAYLLDQWTKAVPEDIRDGLKEVGDLLVVRWNQFRSDVSDRMDAIATVVKAGWAAVQETTGRILGVVRGVVQAAWVTIAGAVTAALAAIQQVVSDGWAAVQTVTAAITATVSQVVSDAWQAIKTSILTPLGEAVALVQAGWTAVLEAVTTALAAALAAVVEFGAGVLKSLGDLVGAVLEQARAIGQAIIDGIKDAIRAGASGIADLIAELARAAIEAAKKALGAKSPSREFYMIGESVTQGLAAGIAATAQVATLAAVRLAEAVMAAAADAAPHWHAVGADLIARFADGIGDNTDAVLGAIAGFSAQAMAALEALKRWIGDAHSGWIGGVAAKRTELLRIFNFAAYLRGEGTKVIPELQDLTNTYIDNVEHAVSTAVGQLEKLAKDYQAAVLAARAEAQKQVVAAISEADTKVAELNEQRSLARRLQAQKDAFAEMQRAQKENFDRQQTQLQDALRTQEQVYRVAFQAQLKLGRVGTDAAPGVTAAQSVLDFQTEGLRIQYEASRDLGRATTEDQKAEITKRAQEAQLALGDRLAEESYLAEATKELRLALQREQIAAEQAQALQALADQQAEEVYVREHTATLRNEIATREAAFNAIVAEQSRVFEARLDQEAFDRQLAQVYAERDARIAAINQALKEKEAALAADLATERQAILDNLQTELADLQTEYIAKVIEAFHHAQVDISDFIGTINEDLKRQTQAVADQVLDLIGQIRDAKQEIGDTPQYAPRTDPTVPDSTPRPDLIPGVVRLPSSLDPRPTQRLYTVNVYPQQATLDEAEIGRVLQRMVLLGG